MKKSLLFLALIGITLSPISYAQSQENYYKISDLEVEEVELDESDYVFIADQQRGKGVGQLGQVIATVDQLVALGERIYKLVEKGRPVVQTKYASVSVLPENVRNMGAFYSMAGWSMPSYRKYVINYKNTYGMKVVSFEFMVMFKHGGQYQGKGKYISDGKIIPKDIMVRWGFNFSANAKVASIANHGSSLNPVAGAQLELEYSVSNVMNTSTKTEVFYLLGDGRIQRY